MKMFKGIIHVHSNYSYDGLHSLEEIARYGSERGYSFIGMSEHSDTLDEAGMVKYVKECRIVSSPTLLILPGIEFSCKDNLHILGLGIEDYIKTREPDEVIRFIRQRSGIAVIAHPCRYGYKIPLNIAHVADGIEVWNAAYDGRFVPDNRSLRLIEEIKKRNGSLLAFGGQDLHQITDHFNVEVTVRCDRLEKASILNAFKKGDFTISNFYFRIDARCAIGRLKLTQIQVARRMYDLAKLGRDSWIRIFAK